MLSSIHSSAFNNHNSQLCQHLSRDHIKLALRSHLHHSNINTNFQFRQLFSRWHLQLFVLGQSMLTVDSKTTTCPFDRRHINDMARRKRILPSLIALLPALGVRPAVYFYLHSPTPTDKPLSASNTTTPDLIIFKFYLLAYGMAWQSAAQLSRSFALCCPFSISHSPIRISCAIAYGNSFLPRNNHVSSFT